MGRPLGLGFNLLAGTTKAVRVKLPAASRTRLARKHHAVARVIAHLTGGATVKRLITLAR